METIFLTFFTLLSKLLGLVRDVSLANQLGATEITDVFIISITVPVVLLESISSALLVNYIPIVSRLDISCEHNKIIVFNGSLISFLFVLITLGVFLFMPFGNNLVSLFALGFRGDKFELLFSFSKITILAAYFIIIGDVFKAYCQKSKRFYSTAVASIVVNISVIIGIFFANLSKYALAYAFLIGNFLTLVILYVDAKKSGFEAKFNLNFKSQELKRMLLLSIPILFNNAIWEINGIIDRSLVSTLGDGYVTALNYANKLTAIIVGIVTASIATVVYPKYSKLGYDTSVLTELLLKDLEKVMRLLIPICLLFVLKGKNIVDMVFFKSQFTSELYDVTIISFKIYSLGIIFTCLKVILFKFYYAQLDTNTPAKNTIVSIALNIFLNLILIRYYGYKGIVAATVITALLTVILLFYNINTLKLRDYFRIADKSFIVALVSLCVIYGLNSFIYCRDFTSSIIYIFVYFSICGSYLYLNDKEIFRFKE